MSKPLQLGIVGAGNIAGAHLDGCKTSGAAQPVAICDIIKERAEKYQTQYNIDHVYLDYHDLLAREDIEAVVVAVPNNLHHEVTIAALQAGKHVLCEKPMSYNLQWANDMLQSAQQAGTVLQIGMVSRYRSDVQWLHKQVQSGNLGHIYFARTQCIRRSGIPGWGSWFTRKDKAGGGPLIDIGVHWLDLAWYIIGCPQPVSVCGATYSEFGPHKKGLGSWGTPEWDGYYDVEDFATALIRFANGATISLEAAWAGYTDSTSSLSLLGSNKGAVLQDGNVRLLSQEDKYDMDTTVALPNKSSSFNSIFAAQMHAFKQAIRGEAPCMAPAEHGVSITAMLAAIYESAKMGAEVKLA